MTDDPMHDESLSPLVERLPRSIEPARDLWPGIEGRLERRPAARRRWLVVLAAAAVIIIAAASSLATAWFLGGREQPAAVASAGDDREAVYLRATAALAQELAVSRDDLAPETVAVLDRNLEIIDRAIAESRAALAADPSNTDLADRNADRFIASDVPYGTGSFAMAGVAAVFVSGLLMVNSLAVSAHEVSSVAGILA